jgi:hypothetical protein
LHSVWYMVCQMKNRRELMEFIANRVWGAS